MAAPTLIPILIRHRSNQEGDGRYVLQTFLYRFKRDLFLENPPEHKTTPREARAFPVGSRSSKDNSFYPACNLILDKVFNRTSCPNFDTERQGFFTQKKKMTSGISNLWILRTPFSAKSAMGRMPFCSNQTICSLAAGSMASSRLSSFFAQTFGL